MRYDHYEHLRQDRLKLLLQERQRLITEFGESGAVPNGRSQSARQSSARSGRPMSARSTGGGDNSMVDREKYKLEVLRKRQEKELQQVRAVEFPFPF